MKNPGPNIQDRSIIWRQGADVRTWWHEELGIERQESLMWAIAGGAGISNGSAYTVPRLLLPAETSGIMLTELVGAERINDEKFSDTDCYRVRSTYGRSEVTIWLEKASFLIRQIETAREFEGFRTEESTTYNPTVNTVIPEERLEFNPPASE